MPIRNTVPNHRQWPSMIQARNSSIVAQTFLSALPGRTSQGQRN
jgi:hypothetical protein